MAAFKSFNNSMHKKVLNLLESGYLRLGGNIVMMFGVNSRGGSHYRLLWNRSKDEYAEDDAIAAFGKR